MGATACPRAASCWLRTVTRGCTCSSSTRSTTPRRRTTDGASTATSGATSTARRAGARRSSATSATGRSHRPKAVAATSATGRSTSSRSARERAAAGPSETAARADLTDAILSVVDTASPSVGRTRVVEILRGGRSKVIVKYDYDALPGYGDFHDWTSDDVLAEVDGLIGAGRLASTGGRFPKLRVAAPRGLIVGVAKPLSHRRPRLGKRHEPPGHPRHAPRARRDRGGRRRLQQAGGAGARPGRRCRDSGRDLPGRAVMRAAKRGTTRLRDWLDGLAVDLVVLAGYMELLSAAFVERFQNRVVNVHPALLPSFPGLDAVGQALDAGVRDDRRDDPLRRRRGGLGPDHPPAARAGPAGP